MYGPTETTIWSLAHAVEAVAGPVPIGRPIDGTVAYVLDSRGELVAGGVDGELYLGGPGVSRGYHRRPELSADRFVVNPFPGDHGPRLYRTGDRVRYRDDGRLEFLGRSDQQVKIRGHRVELGEIEATLLALPGVREAAVVIADAGDRSLHGYVTANTPGLSGDACRAALRQQLPEVMVPAAIVVVEALPRTPNGKLDRRALPAPAAAAPTVAPQPGNLMQQQVAAIWREVLQLETVGVDDNFFDRGGHSLMTVQVAQRLSTLVARRVPLTALFRFPTIRALARHLEEPDSSVAGDSAQTGRARAAARRAARRHDR